MARVAPGIEQRGDSLRITIDYKGQRIRETHPGCDKQHIRQAIKRREWLLSRLRVGLPVFEDDERQLGLVADSYFDTLDVKRSTLRSYENLYKTYWSRWQTYTPDHISTLMIRQRLSEFDVSNKTKRNALGVLSAILRHADVNPNPCSPIRLKRNQRPPVQRYGVEEVSTLLSHLDGEAKVYFTLMASTGMRPGEMLALEWSDWDGGRLDVSKQVVRRRLIQSTKTSVRRRVLVPEPARSALNGHTTRFKGGYVFQNTQGTFHCDTDVFNGAWKKAHQKARIPYRIPYTLRHTRAAVLLSQKCDPARAAKELGHSVQMFFNVYSEWIDEYAEMDDSALSSPFATQKASKLLK